MTEGRLDLLPKEKKMELLHQGCELVGHVLQNLMLVLQSRRDLAGAVFGL